MVKKKRNLPKQNPSQIAPLGIPVFNRAEKLNQVVPVKVGSTLKKAIPQPQSTWVRKVIIERLQRMEEESFE